MPFLGSPKMTKRENFEFAHEIAIIELLAELEDVVKKDGKKYGIKKQNRFIKDKLKEYGILRNI
jgi:hypothetical protein